ncbi:terminase large subunit domain-containing protein [Xenorhabdus innexi]|uniref:Oxidoreductase n=1 Tax=Xenorhabdus innexi TaxID=290109 RepID=A0A1N6MS33_9GAMM|nr:terminase family protein [Xenorhabdus innexi]PHM38573.1 oxidoreductase [Xenorhabdus innexi]SIP71584.1 Terminase, ATPase subunit [Xenorhabdus innexi]
MMMTTHDLRQEAKSLYWQAYSIAQIAKRLGVSVNTLYSWRRRDKWDDANPIERVSDALHVKILRMQAKEALTPHDFKTLDFLCRQLERFERHEVKKDKQTQAKTPKNHFSAEQITELRTRVYESLFEYQKRWYKQKEQRNRMILKSRQIGATWYFAREALITALETGNNQIFLSASRAQAFQFKKFIQIVARQVGVELKGGNEIILSNGATLYFLGTSAASAQSYTGDLYFDEFFHVINFVNLRSVAAGMATHMGLRRTYFSTPSSEEHAAYPFWTGDFFNKSRPHKQQITIDTRHTTLQPGVLCGDNIWRQVVTIHDAIALGLNRVDLDDIVSENSPADFDNLYRCIFVKAGERAFDYNEVIKCGVDGYNEDVWPDWKPYAPRPLGYKGVYIGADPTGTGGNGDGLGLVVLSPSAVSGGKWRVIEALQFRGMAFERQADEIRKLTDRYQVLGIAIDGTGGTGEAVHELVCKFFPAATLLKYSAPLKRMLVMKAQMLIRSGRFEYDAGMKQVATSFMSIKKIITQGGVVTYDADRTRGIDHGDIAWAVMNVLHGEPISSDSGGYTSFVTEF